MKKFFHAAVCVCAFFAFLGVVQAYGLERLSASSVSLARGTGLVHVGVGLQEGSSARLSVFVPSGVQVKQVLLYWQGLGSGDSTVHVNAQHLVRGGLAGDSEPFLHPASLFRADITALNLVRSGMSVLEVTGYRFGHRNMGAHVVVVVDDGTGARPLFLRDGLDYVYGGAAEGSLSKVSREQEFVFEPACVPRDGVLSLAAGGGLASAYDEVVVTVGHEVFVYRNFFRSSSGSHWDVLRFPVYIPPAVSRVKVKVVTRADVASGMGADAVAWVLASLEGPCETCAASKGALASNRMACFAVNEASVYRAYAFSQENISALVNGYEAHLSGYFVMSSKAVFKVVDISELSAFLTVNGLDFEAPAGGWTARSDGWFGYRYQEVFACAGFTWEIKIQPSTGAWEWDYFSSDEGFMDPSGRLNVYMSVNGQKKGRHNVQTTFLAEDFVGEQWFYDEPLHEHCDACRSSQ